MWLWIQGVWGCIGGKRLRYLVELLLVIEGEHGRLGKIISVSRLHLMRHVHSSNDETYRLYTASQYQIQPTSLSTHYALTFWDNARDSKHAMHSRTSPNPHCASPPLFPHLTTHHFCTTRATNFSRQLTRHSLSQAATQSFSFVAVACWRAG